MKKKKEINKTNAHGIKMREKESGTVPTYLPRSIPIAIGGYCSRVRKISR